MDKQSVLTFVRNHFFGIMGGVLGFVLAILFFTIGWWKTLLLVALVGVGLYIGRKIDGKNGMSDVVDRVMGGQNHNDY